MSEQTKQPAHCQWSFTDLPTSERLKCDRLVLPGFDYCLFHKPEKTSEEVAQFTEAICAQVEEDQNFNFAGFRFPPDWDYFQERTLTAPDFRDAEFEGAGNFPATHFEPRVEGGFAANFGGARFGGGANFGSAHFGGDAWFWGARFGGSADFWEARFGGRADFGDAQFAGRADFGGARFDGIALFLGARFGRHAYFFVARFGGDAGFWGARFGGDAEFGHARLGGDADFRGAHFARKADFKGTVFSGLADWEEAHFHAQADFTDVAQPADSRFLIGLPRADRKSAGKQTRFAQPATGSQLCRLAKETARRAGDYRLAGDYFYFERMYADLTRLPWPFFAWRRLLRRLHGWRVTRPVARWLQQWRVIGGLLRWPLPDSVEGADGKPFLNRQELEKAWLRPQLDPKPTAWDKSWGAVRLLFGCLVFGYGERPLRVFGWSLTVVCFWAALYWCLGLVRLSGATYPIHGLLQNLYFSVVTFTTLGFGDFEPVKTFWGMLFAASEAFIGMFMIALFVVSVAKRFSRG